MGRVADLRADYDRLGKMLKGEVDGAKAAALARERRLIGEMLERLESAEGQVPFVDQVGKRRRLASVDGPPVRRRKSG